MKDNAKKSLINISVLLPLHILQILINFVLKTVFIRTLGQDYLGINVLFGDITTLLSLTELGLNTAIMFALYRPLNTKDNQKISAIMNYSKSLFNRIALSIMLIGLAIIPGLKYVVNSQINMNAIIWYYILYLITVAVTYLATYKSTLISADEKNYIVKIYYTVFNAIRAAIQIILLFTTKNFTLYLFTGIACNLLFNLAITMKVNKSYPAIDKTARLDKSEKKEMFSNTKAIFKYKIAELILNNTDNILISTIISTTIVGQYSSYTTLYTTLVGLMSNFYNGIIHTIGKLNINENSDEKHHTFNLIHTVIFIITGISAACFYLLADDFINLWIGPDYIMDKKILLAIVLNFYLTIIFYPINIYKNTTKLFVKAQNVVIVTAIANIVLSIIMAQYFGLFGILIATSISKILTSFWAEPYLLFKKFFDTSWVDLTLYYIRIFLEIIFTIITATCVNVLTQGLPATTWGGLIVKAIVCASLCTIIILSGMNVSEDYRKITRAIYRKVFHR